MKNLKHFLEELMVCVLTICLDEFTTLPPFACWPVVALTMLSVSFPIVKTLCTIIYTIENNQKNKTKQKKTDWWADGSVGRATFCQVDDRGGPSFYNFQHFSFLFLVGIHFVPSH